LTEDWVTETSPRADRQGCPALGTGHLTIRQPVLHVEDLEHAANDPLSAPKFQPVAASLDRRVSATNPRVRARASGRASKLADARIRCPDEPALVLMKLHPVIPLHEAEEKDGR